MKIAISTITIVIAGNSGTDGDGDADMLGAVRNGTKFTCPNWNHVYCHRLCC
jgi:hypothetical protein